MARENKMRMNKLKETRWLFALVNRVCIIFISTITTVFFVLFFISQLLATCRVQLLLLLPIFVIVMAEWGDYQLPICCICYCMIFLSCAQFNCSHTHREEGEMRNQNYFLLTKGKKLCRNWAIHSATPTTSWLQFLFEIWQFLHIEIQLKILFAFEYGLNFLFSNITMRSSSYSACKCIALKRFANSKI